MSDDGPLYLSAEGFNRQKALLDVDNDELFDQMADVVMQLCIRFRMRPRELFEATLTKHEEYLEAVIPVMAEALENENVSGSAPGAST